MVIIKECKTLCFCHEAYLSATALKKFSLLNKSWVKVVKIKSKNEGQFLNRQIVGEKFTEAELRKDSYVIQINVRFEAIGLSDDVDLISSKTDSPDCLYISPVSFFNVCDRNVDLYNKHRIQGLDVTLEHVIDFAGKAEEGASECQLSVISCSPCILPQEVVDSTICEYFKTPQIIQQGEILRMRVSLPKWQVHPKYISFTVNKVSTQAEHLQTNAVIVSAETSTMFQSEPVQCSIPGCYCCSAGFADEMNYAYAFETQLQTFAHLRQLMITHKIASKDLCTLLEGDHGTGKRTLLRTVCQLYCWHYIEGNCLKLLSDGLGASEKRLENLFATAQKSTPCVLYLRNVELLGKDREGLHEERRITQTFIGLLESTSQVLVVGGTCDVKKIEIRMFSNFLYNVKLPCPNIDQRKHLIRIFYKDEDKNDCWVNELAQKTAGFVFSDICALVHNLSDCKDDSTTTITSAVERLRKQKSDMRVNIPKVSWSDVGGLSVAKEEIMNTIELPLKHPHLFKHGFTRSGLLFYGPPGCGKTLLAKAVATEFSLNFYSVKGPELIDMYVGQSEENIRAVFTRARHLSPCVVFFDELDSLAPKRGRTGDAGGVMDRIVSQLLAELDGMTNNNQVFVVGATNRPDLIEPALLRPGRFDKLVYVGVARTNEERLKLLTSVTNKLLLSDDVDFSDLLKNLARNFTGADFYALATDAQMNAYRRAIRDNSTDATVTQQDFLVALGNVSPSVSEADIRRYQQMTEIFSKNNEDI